ncbi:CDP-glycerol glycerophosphotransferase family protein [Brevibacterium sp. CCUG 69071]|uniref:CDP-glycerol glycerophosphotransferase family protein n=1 Tax=Brevibacterium sp. CCUG 69071 TaxID=2052937 RepID=UPI001E61012D|nr:CDP-glycerol glycerophosphotransferase family protein [Brevibacterium sp. CCUG 69071]
MVRSIGGYLPEPLSRRSTLMSAGLSAFILLAFSGHLVGLILGLLLVAAVWYSEMTLALTSTPTSLARHSTISFEYMLVLSIGLGAVYTSWFDESAWVEWCALLLLSVSSWLVSAQPPFLAVRPIQAANLTNLPVIGEPPRIQVKGLLRLVWAGYAVIALLLLIGGAIGPWISVIVSVVVLAAVAWNVVAAWIWADKARWRTLRELRRMEPVAMMPYGGSAAFHIPMWEEYVRQLKVPYFIETLREPTVAKLAKLTDAPIVCPADSTAKEINSVIPPSVRGAFYVHNAASNKGFLENRDITSIWVHHGDGDKIASYRAKSGSYDFLFVAGQGAIDRYGAHGVSIPEEKFRIIGRPQTESIDVESTPISSKTSLTVLYAPTWHGKSDDENYSSLEFGEAIVRGLIERNANVIFRPHPASRSAAKFRKIITEIQDLLAQDAETSQRTHVWGPPAEGDVSVADVANASDAMVSDVSGIVTDYMQSNKPYAMVTLRMSEKDFKAEYPTTRASYVITGDEASLNSALDDMLGDDPLREARQVARAYYLGGFEGQESAHRFIAESSEILGL